VYYLINQIAFQGLTCPSFRKNANQIKCHQINVTYNMTLLLSFADFTLQTKKNYD
jgi:hypothetical protein